MSRIVKVLLLAVLAFIGFGYLLDYLNAKSRSRVGSVIRKAYQQSAARGEVPKAATTPDGLLLHARCGLSYAPNHVEVKTDSGERYSYIAQQLRSSNRTSNVWTFKFISGKDAKGNSITNWPNI